MRLQPILCPRGTDDLSALRNRGNGLLERWRLDGGRSDRRRGRDDRCGSRLSGAKQVKSVAAIVVLVFDSLGFAAEYPLEKSRPLVGMRGDFRYGDVGDHISWCNYGGNEAEAQERVIE